MTDFDQQLRTWWAKMTAWLHGGQHSEGAARAKATLRDFRESETGRKAEAAFRDLRDGAAPRDKS